MTTAQILKSIADDTRLSVIRHLAQQNAEVSCSEILKDCSLALNLSQPTMSHHFSRLVQADVLLERKAGKEKYYQLNVELLSNIGINPHKL